MPEHHCPCGQPIRGPAYLDAGCCEDCFAARCQRAFGSQTGGPRPLSVPHETPNSAAGKGRRVPPKGRSEAA